MLLFGRNVCTETIRSKLEYEKVIVKESFKDPILDYMKKNRIRYDILPDNTFNNKYPNSQGIVIEMKEYKYADFNECLKSTNNNSLVLILDSIEDPQNFGNMIRTFEALGGSFIIIPKNRSVEVNPTVAKVSAGAFANVNIVQVSNINNAISKLKDNGINNARFYYGNMLPHLYQFEKEGWIPDVLIVDPPRTGMDINLLHYLQDHPIKKIIYVSCNPATLAKNCNHLNSKYHILHIQPLDMFPQTSNVECVVCLERR